MSTPQNISTKPARFPKEKPVEADAVVEGKRPSYFQLNVDRLSEIPSCAVVIDGKHVQLGADEMVVYIGQSAGVDSKQSKPDRRVSTHGVKSMSDRCAIGETYAKRAIRALTAANFLSQTEPELGADRQSIGQGRFVVDAGQVPDVQLAMTLTQPVNERTGKTVLGTLAHLNTSIGIGDGIPKQLAVMDALRVFAVLHRLQDFDSFGGVDPSVIYGICDPIEPELAGVGTEPVMPIAGLAGWSLVTAEKPSELLVADQFRLTTMSYLPSEEGWATPQARFDHALRQLKKWGLVYDALVLWDEDPRCAQRFRASPLATVYVGNWRDAKLEARLQETVHEVSCSTGTLQRSSLFGAYADPDQVFDGRHRYIVEDHLVGRAKLVLQLRVRHWAHDDRTLRALRNDALRVERMATQLRELKARWAIAA